MASALGGMKSQKLCMCFSWCFDVEYEKAAPKV